MAYYGNGGGASRGGRGGGVGSKIHASKNENDSRKIFVGGVSRESTAEDLKAYFEKFGAVVDATLKTDPETGRSRGFGFVLFNDAESVDRVCESKNHVLHGKQIDPKRAVAGGAAAGAGVKKIFVGGLEPSLTEEDIRQHFSQYGKVELVELPYDKVKNQRRAFGFITFDSSEVVDQICANEKIPYGDKMLDVRKAAPKDQQNGMRGGGRGGGMGMGRGGGRGGRGGPAGGYGAPGAYDYNGTYQSGYTGYDYYGGAYGAPAGPSYDAYGAPTAQPSWGGGYDQSAGAYGAPAAAPGAYGGYDYSGGWQQGAGDASAYGKAKRGAPAAGAYGGGAAGGYHPYSRW